MALPGSVPTEYGGGAIDPSSLFSSEAERDKYRRLIYGDGGSSPRPVGIKIDKVSVRIFDLSDEDQVAEYEKLWAELLEKSSRMEVIVDSRKDLVHRKDGTSYWMKYVEYVEFSDGDVPGDNKKSQKGDGDGRRD